MLVVYGKPSHSSFKVQALQEALGRPDLRVAPITVAHTHTELSASDNNRLKKILNSAEAPPTESPTVLIGPRLGTISPWSSKATEIIQACHITGIERLESLTAYWLPNATTDELDKLQDMCCDRMTQTLFRSLEEAERLFDKSSPKPVSSVALGDDPLGALNTANIDLGLALSPDEIQYLSTSYMNLQRDPTDVELLMFSQANSEHCRHKIFNADWTIDGVIQDLSLFNMIKNTHAASPFGVLSAYSDNAAVIRGYQAGRFFPSPENHEYGYSLEPIHIAIKVETHNHPTGISPHPGAATGSGGEIRDEGATGRGGKPKAGLCGFSVSDLHIPANPLPWEGQQSHPKRMATPLEIMTEGPIGAAAFNNEFGRPNLTGYFRTFHQKVNGKDGLERRGYHKPIMIAGGYGNVRPSHVKKDTLKPGYSLVVLGGPAMLIGLGGGSASSVSAGDQSEALDFASVQRANPEMQRRCQEVLDRCWAMGDHNPIVSVHDVGAGGLSNAFPELVHDSDCGGHFNLRAIPNAEPQLSPMEIWCNEAQERYVLGIKPSDLPLFEVICRRENAPYAMVGEAVSDDELILNDTHFKNSPIDLPLSIILGKTPKMHRVDNRVQPIRSAIRTGDFDLKDAACRVLRLPTVASKSFLITIGDRSITGMVARDQMVGRWQVPVADCAVTTASFDTLKGEAMAMGERTPLALLNAAASGRMAIGEAITNIAAARIGRLSDIKLSANWMVAAGHPGEGANLYDTVQSIGMDLCPKLGIAIPVGKDSMSMRAKWQDGNSQEQVTAPLSLVVTAFAPAVNARQTLTPELRTDINRTELWLIDLGGKRNRLGGSALGYVHDLLGKIPPNLDEPEKLSSFFRAIQFLNQEGLLLSYHDRSDGGLWATLCEMAFAGRCGMRLDITSIDSDPIRALFTEELGAVVQIRTDDREWFTDTMEAHGLMADVHHLGRPSQDMHIDIHRGSRSILRLPVLDLYELWTECSHHIQKQRDNPNCADEEKSVNLNPDNTGLYADVDFDFNADLFSEIDVNRRPKVAILREQGVNGHVEMAAAFDRAGFSAIDVHMSDLTSQRVDLADFKGLVACGGFSYGDVLGAGGGWANRILQDETLKVAFKSFFHRTDTFSLGVCNGCQMLSQLKSLIPGAANWPRFVHNDSAQFEARLAQIKCEESPSIFFRGMKNASLPIPVAHGEGKVQFDTTEDMENAICALRYVDHNGQPSNIYPQNPNGSKDGATSYTTTDGRATIMMPHPERAFRSVQFSWSPHNWGENSPWMRFFQNARIWVDQQEKK